ncbi:MAG: Ig-like domain-containing protein, partial [Proteobacteria bacterium]|nr:Ig-like domain-containing protein [Pseudomonadota bacterium]
MSYFLLLLLALTGCDDNTGVPGGDDDDATSGPGTVNLFETSPEPEQSDFFFRAPLEIEFTAAPDTGTLTLADAGGADVLGETSWNDAGTKLTFNPAADLVPSSDYTATITWTPTEFEPFVLDFSTDVYGSPMDDTAALVGDVYSLDLAGATFIE